MDTAAIKYVQLVGWYTAWGGRTAGEGSRDVTRKEGRVGIKSTL